jgi:hypothetical protein
MDQRVSEILCQTVSACEKHLVLLPLQPAAAAAAEAEAEAVAAAAAACLQHWRLWVYEELERCSLHLELWLHSVGLHVHSEQELCWYAWSVAVYAGNMLNGFHHQLQTFKRLISENFIHYSMVHPCLLVCCLKM